MDINHLVHSKPESKDLARFSGDCKTIAAKKTKYINPNFSFKRVILKLVNLVTADLRFEHPKFGNIFRP
jgi:hypothetical protein